MKVLIVDDSSTIRRMLRSLLQSDGIEVVECTDGQEAIDQYGAHSPDIVLMDLEMKQVDGFEATRQIKTSFPEARIFILTSFNDEFMKAAATGAGASGYLLKEDLQQIRAFLKEISEKP